MSVRVSSRHQGAARWGWGILVGLCGLLIVNGLLLYLVVVDTAPEQTLSILLSGFGALGLVVAVEGFRRQTRWAWHGTWVVVGVLVVVAVHMLVVGRVDVSGFYFALGAVGLGGQLLARSGLRQQ
jgi:hypothetical protein